MLSGLSTTGEHCLFQVYVSEASNPAKVKVFGPGVSPGVKTNAKTYFVVDCKLAGPGKPRNNSLLGSCFPFCLEVQVFPEDRLN